MNARACLSAPVSGAGLGDCTKRWIDLCCGRAQKPLLKIVRYQTGEFAMPTRLEVGELASRTCMASSPSALRAAATFGDVLLSIRYLRRWRPVMVPPVAGLPPRSGVPERCPLLRGPDRDPGSRRSKGHSQPYRALRKLGFEARECTEPRPAGSAAG